MRATIFSRSASARLVARFTATVVVPTPPLLPITLMILPCFFGPSAFWGFSADCCSLSLWSARLTSSLLRGWGKNSLTPARIASIRISDLRTFDVRKTSRAAPELMICWTCRISSSGRSPSCRMSRSAAPESPGPYVAKPSSDDTIRVNSCRMRSSFMSRRTFNVCQFHRFPCRYGLLNQSRDAALGPVFTATARFHTQRCHR